MKKAEINGISLVLPTFNEKENIAKIIPLVSEQLESLAIPFEIIVADGNSPDGTAAVAQKLAEEGYKVRTIVAPKKLGLAVETLNALKQAKFNICACMDADLQHDPKYIPALYREMVKGSDMVIGSRYVETPEFNDWPLHRIIMSKVAVQVTRLLTSIHDPLTQYYMIRKKFVDSAENTKGGLRLSLQLVMFTNPSVKEIPIEFHSRENGESTQGFFTYASDVIVFFKLWLIKLTSSFKKNL